MTRTPTSTVDGKGEGAMSGQDYVDFITGKRTAPDPVRREEPNMTANITGNPYEEYVFIKTANETGYTVPQVRTITRLETETQRSYEAECRRVRRGDAPCWPQRDDVHFRVKHDARLGLPRVDYVTMDGWYWTDIAVLADGSLDRTL